MCGIVAVVRRPGSGVAPVLAELIATLDGASARFVPGEELPTVADIETVTAAVDSVDRLKG